MDGPIEVMCTRKCGFRVPPDYMERKRRFAAHCCPRADCGGPLAVVYQGTDQVAEGYEYIPYDDRGRRIGRVRARGQVTE